jgi:hypothetical protein
MNINKSVCPHCFGKYETCNGVSTNYHVNICELCADGSAVWSALTEWDSAKPRKSFAEWVLASHGYEISEDSDQPGKWLWVAPCGDASEVSFHTKEEAIADAQRHASNNLNPENDEWYATLMEGSEVWWNDPDDGISSGYYRITEIKLPGGDEAISPSTVVVLENEHCTVVEAFVSELSPSKPECKRSNRLRLVLDVEYNPNGESIEEMRNNLRQLVERAVGEGLLTESSNAEVDRYSVDVFHHPEISEDEIADYFAAQIEDGHISPSEVAIKFARYGLMDPSEFAMEMQERIEMMIEMMK